MDSSNKALAIMDSRTVKGISAIEFLLLRAHLEEAFNSMIIVAITVFRPTIQVIVSAERRFSPIANSAIIKGGKIQPRDIGHPNLEGTKSKKQIFSRLALGNCSYLRILRYIPSSASVTFRGVVSV